MNASPRHSGKVELFHKVGTPAYVLPVQFMSLERYSEGATVLATAKIKNPQNIPTSFWKGHNPEGRPAFVTGCYLPTGALEALKWTNIQLCGSKSAHWALMVPVLRVSQLPKPFLFIRRDPICKTFIQGLIINKSLHGATPLKGCTIAWPGNQCPIHALISGDKWM